MNMIKEIMDPKKDRQAPEDNYGTYEKSEKVNPKIDPDATKNEGISEQDDKQWRSKQEKK